MEEILIKMTLLKDMEMILKKMRQLKIILMYQIILLNLINRPIVKNIIIKLRIKVWNLG